MAAGALRSEEPSQDDQDAALERAASVVASEELFREMAAPIDQVFWMYSVDPFCLLYSSPAAKRIFGFDPMMDAGDTSEANPERMLAAVHPDDLPIFMDLLGEMLTTPREREYRIVRPDGEIRWVQARVFPILDEKGAVYRIAGVTQDITLRKQAERDLRMAGALQSLITDLSADFVSLSAERLDDAFVHALRSVAQLAQASGAAVLLLDDAGSTLELRWHWAEPEIPTASLRSMPLSEPAAAYELARDTPRAHVVAELPDHLGFVRQSLLDSGLRSLLEIPLLSRGTLLGVLAFASTDVRTWPAELPALLAIAARMFANVIDHVNTEEEMRAHRDQLAHVLRLKTMGQLTSGIAHELNQPLSAILNYSSGCVLRLANGDARAEDIRPALESITEQAVRAADVIRMLRALVKAQTHRSRHEVADLIRDTLRLMQPQLTRGGIRILCDHGYLPPAQVDGIQIEQVLLNLLSNACSAVMETAPREREIHVSATLRDASTIEISIRDNGPGIDPLRASDVFEDFFTTKPDGLGLGLPISRSIVEAHGGRLWLDGAKVGPGACFRFTLPVAPPSPD